MKVSASVSDLSTVGTEQFGRDITTPGIYKGQRPFGGERHFYLIVMDSVTKLYVNDDGTEIQTAAGILQEKVVPVKEKITIVFDTTKD